MKLKDYEIPQYGPGGGLDHEDLKQYSLKNFDLKAYQLTQQQPDPVPIPAPCEPYLLTQETDIPIPVATAPEESFHYAPNPVQPEPSPLVPDPCEVQFGAHFALQQPLYIAASPAQSWKMPRWVVTTVGLFFGSAVVLTIAFCVVLLRDPKAPATEPSPIATPTAPVATTTSAPPTQPVPSPAMNKAPADVSRAASPPRLATANLVHDDAALPHRIVVSRHPSAVRRHVYGSRRVAGKSSSSSGEPQPETETASRRPAPDALDKLLSESSL